MLEYVGIVLTLPLASNSMDLFGIFWHSAVCLGMSPRIPSVWNVFEVAHPVGALAVEGFGTHFGVWCLLTSCLPGHVSEHLPCSMWALCSALRISRVGFSQEIGAFSQAFLAGSLVCGHFLEVVTSKLIFHTLTCKNKLWNWLKMYAFLK